MSKIIGLIIIVLGLAGVYHVYLDYAVKQKERTNHWAEDMAALIREHSPDKQIAGAEDPWFASEGSFYRILAMMHDAEHNKYSSGDTVKKAASISGTRPGEAKMIVDMLSENYRIAKQLGVFDDLPNVLRMQRGEPPICQAKGWEDEPLSVGHLLSPIVAPEASRSLVNLVLMPKGMRDLQTDDLTGFTPELSKKWLSERIITPDTHRAITDVLATRKF